MKRFSRALAAALEEAQPLGTGHQVLSVCKCYAVAHSLSVCHEGHENSFCKPLAAGLGPGRGLDLPLSTGHQVHTLAGMHGSPRPACCPADPSPLKSSLKCMWCSSSLASACCMVDCNSRAFDLAVSAWLLVHILGSYALPFAYHRAS